MIETRSCKKGWSQNFKINFLKVLAERTQQMCVKVAKRGGLEKRLHTFFCKDFLSTLAVSLPFSRFQIPQKQLLLDGIKNFKNMKSANQKNIPNSLFSPIPNLLIYIVFLFFFGKYLIHHYVVPSP